MINEATATANTAHDISVVIAPMIVDIAQQHGSVVTILALIGIFSIFNAMVRISMPIIEVLGMVFVITPLIMIMSLTSKEKRYGLKDEVRDVIKHAKTNPKAVIGFILYIVGFIVVVFVFAATMMHFGI